MKDLIEKYCPGPDADPDAVEATRCAMRAASTCASALLEMRHAKSSEDLRVARLSLEAAAEKVAHARALGAADPELLDRIDGHVRQITARCEARYRASLRGEALAALGESAAYELVAMEGPVLDRVHRTTTAWD